MKKYVLYATILVATFAVSPAMLFSQVQLGVRAGVNFSNVIYKDADGNKSLSTDLIPGFHIGAIGDIALADDYYVQPGILFTTKGFKMQESDGDAKVTFKLSPYYIEVPVNFLYKPILGNGRLLLGVGPYFAYGIGGSWEVTATDGSTKISKDGNLVFKNNVSSSDSANFNDWNSIPDELPYGKAFDMGANALIGYEFSNHFSFQVNGQLGLINNASKYNGESTGETQKNIQFGASIVYKF